MSYTTTFKTPCPLLPPEGYAENWEKEMEDFHQSLLNYLQNLASTPGLQTDTPYFWSAVMALLGNSIRATREQRKFIRLVSDNLIETHTSKVNLWIGRMEFLIEELILPLLKRFVQTTLRKRGQKRLSYPLQSIRRLTEDWISGKSTPEEDHLRTLVGLPIVLYRFMSELKGLHKALTCRTTQEKNARCRIRQEMLKNCSCTKYEKVTLGDFTKKKLTEERYEELRERIIGDIPETERQIRMDVESCYADEDQLFPLLLQHASAEGLLNAGLCSAVLLKELDKEYQTQQNKPQEKGELFTPEAQKLWEICRQNGWVDENLQPKMSVNKIVILASIMADILELKYRWQPFEELWNKKSLASVYSNSQLRNYYDTCYKKFLKALS